MSSGTQKVMKNREAELPEAGNFYWASWRMNGRGANYQHIEITQRKPMMLLERIKGGEESEAERRTEKQMLCPWHVCNIYCWDYRLRKAAFVMNQKKIGVCCSILHQQWDYFHRNSLCISLLHIKWNELLYRRIRQKLTWVGDAGDILGILYFSHYHETCFKSSMKICKYITRLFY